MAEGSKPEGILLGEAEATPGQSAELRVLGKWFPVNLGGLYGLSFMAAIEEGLGQIWPLIKMYGRRRGFQAPCWMHVSQ